MKRHQIINDSSDGYGSPFAPCIGALSLPRRPMSPTVVHEAVYSVADETELAARRVGFPHCIRCRGAIIGEACINCSMSRQEARDWLLRKLRR